MTSAANDLLTAIRIRLGADAELTQLIGPDGIRDRLISGRALPCVVIAELASNDYSTSTEASEEHLLTLEIWSDAGGRKLAEEIAHRVRTLLHDATLDLAVHHLVNLHHRQTQSRRQPKTKLHVAEMRFRAVTEAVGA
ncbi:DUF3168 domain-containing protein [Rhizobium sp. S152]|uniref:DUF3168 domain-containing protein n=1 Tax=Rhizobium sp. S152 TaxID=3055038 RepID=UPI0025A99E2A|nr:DUF3168 domain-containing protein [Rhizobium sp. S152]MDM9629077.1 DUF3168 domain-containing protein [Rhizobium sp. S152]